MRQNIWKKKARFPDVDLTGTKLQYVRQCNNLGVRLDNRLTFEAHANEFICLVPHKLFLLTDIRKYIDKKQALPIYKSKIMPFFYWELQVKTRDMLQNLQNRAPRLVLNRVTRHNVWELHHEALMLNKRRGCHLLNYMHERKNISRYIQTSKRHLRLYEEPVFIEHQSKMPL